MNIFNNNMNIKLIFKKFISWFEKFGRIMLLPISVLPLLGLMYGIGSIFSTISYNYPDQTIWIHLQNVFKTFGGVALWNLDVIFAVAIAAGLAKKQRASAAVAGLLTLFMIYYTSSWILTMWSPPGAHGVILTDSKDVEAWNKTANVVDKINIKQFGLKNRFGKTVYDFNVLGGIMAGLIAYYVSKKTVDLKFHPYLSFFEGAKFSPIASVLAAFLVGVPVTFIWSILNSGLKAMGVGLESSGSGGAFTFGFFERLLIPFGLHHTINQTIYWTPVGGTLIAAQNVGDIKVGQEISGSINILLYRLGTSIKGLQETWDSGQQLEFSNFEEMKSIHYIIPTESLWWCSGQYVMKVFGLAGAAIAMVLTSDKKNRKFASSVVFGALSSATITGITEPIEFTFLFVSPLLFFVHAILSGFAALSMSLLSFGSASPAGGTGVLQWLIFVAGNYAKFENIWGIFIIGPIFGALYFFVFYFLIKWRNIATPGRNGAEVVLVGAKEARDKHGIVTNKISLNDSEEETSKVNEKTKKIKKTKKAKKQLGLPLETIDLLIKSHGGVENIEEVTNCISRLRITVKNTKKVKITTLKKDVHSVNAIIVGFQVQTIYGTSASDIKNQILLRLGRET